MMLKVGNRRVKFSVSHRRIKYARIEIRGMAVYLTLPYGFNDQEHLIRKHLSWIEKKLDEYELLLEKSRKVKLEHRSMNELRTLVRGMALKLSRELGVKVPLIKYRKMKRRWASMSSSGIMTVSLSVGLLPERLVNYIIFHEMCHLIEMSHNRKFKELIRRKYPNYKALDMELKSYWMAVQSLNTAPFK